MKNLKKINFQNEDGTFLNKQSIDLVNKAFVRKEMYKILYFKVESINRDLKKSVVLKDSVIEQRDFQINIKDLALYYANDSIKKLNELNSDLLDKINRLKTTRNFFIATTITFAGVTYFLTRKYY